MAGASITDILDGYEFTDFDGNIGQHRAYVHRELGTVHCVSDDLDLEDDLPEDLDSSLYLQLPDRHALDLGARLAVDFAHEHLASEDAHRVSDFFHRRGAYGRFKDLLERRNLLQRWYDHEQQAKLQRLRQWCADNGIALRD